MHLATTFSVLLLFARVIVALPYPDARRGKREDDDEDDDCGNTPKYNAQPICSLSSQPALPPSTLPAPSTGLILKYVVLGRGTQNYTCTSSTSPPVAAGAVAILYDVSCLVTKSKPRSSLSDTIVPALLGAPSASVESYLPDRLAGAKAGIHYFKDGTTPFFGLDTGAFAAVGKVGECPAPASATGNQNGAAVSWLKLARKPAEAPGGIEEVFRVGTAGGRAPATCTAVGTLTVDYLAEYWMYG